MDKTEVIEILTEIMNDGGRYGKAAFYAIKLIEDMEERIAIMSEDQYKSSEIRFP